MAARVRDLRDYFPAEEVRAYLRKHPGARLKTSHPLKYLGIESDGTRLSLQQVMRLLRSPRSHDNHTKGLRLSAHRRAFIQKFPAVDAQLQALREIRPAGGDAYWAKSRHILKLLKQKTGIPVRISTEVLRKGLAAYRRGHRPGMSAHGWAHARLTSFVMRGCTHYNPDHLLVAAAKKAGAFVWSRDVKKCLCKKHCQVGLNTPANYY